MSAGLLMKSKFLYCDDEMKKSLTPRYVWDDQLRFEKERLKTFKSWPLEWLDKNVLAKTGMFYIGDGDKTQCYFCQVIIGKWEPQDDPVQEHLRWSRNCPLLRRCLTNNEPLCHTSLDALLPSPQPANYDTPPPAAPKDLKTTPSFDYSVMSVRLSTFAAWPRSMKQKPEQLAEAGFYYSGVGDGVICFSCLGGLKDWEDDDEPWEQHALWMGHYCQYVKHIKGDQYIEKVKKKLENFPKKTLDTKEYEKLNVPTEQDKDKSAEMESKLCKICYDNVCNTVYIPCGHVISCAQCAFEVKECPLCRASVERTVRLYFC